MFKNRMVPAAVAFCAAVSLVACSGGSTGTSGAGASGGSTKAGTTGGKVAFIPKLTGVGFFESGGKGATEAGPKFGLDVRYTGSPEASVANQVQLINNSVGQGYKAIIVSSTSPDGLCNSLKKAMSQGVVVLTWDSDTNPDCRQFYISQGTPDQLGNLLVKMTSDGLPKDQAAEVAFHYSSPTVTDQNQWVKVAEATIKSDTKWTIVDKVYSGEATDKAVQVAEALINSHPKLKAIICPDANALPGTAKAIENLNRKDIVVVGFSTPNTMRQYVKSGTIKQFALWDVVKQGELSVAVAADLLKGTKLKVGDKVSVPGFGDLTIQPNDVQGYDKSMNAANSGVIVLPERVVFTKDNIDKYNF